MEEKGEEEEKESGQTRRNGGKGKKTSSCTAERKVRVQVCTKNRKVYGKNLDLITFFMPVYSDELPDKAV